MAEVKNKVVTVESLKAKHDYDESAYLKKSGGNVTGDVALIGSDLYVTDIYINENGGAKGQIFGLTPYGNYVPNIQICNENGNCVIGHGNYTNGTGNTNIYSGDNISMFLAGNETTEGVAVFNARNSYGNMEINRMGQFDGGRTYIFGSDIYLGRGNNGNVIEYKPYFAAGDTISVNISTAGYVTTGSTEICFTLPIAKPIIGNPTLTVTTDGGLVLRQNAKYTHGSSSGSCAYPTSYTLGVQAGGNFISVRAKLSDITNATNNDAIGITWNAVITLS